MASFSKFATNLIAATNGVEVPYEDGIVFTIARNGESNPAYRKMLKELLKPLERKYPGFKNVDKSEAFAEEFAEVQNKVFAEVILLGWKGVTDETGAEYTYSKDRAYALLSNPEYSETIRAFIFEQAEKVSLFAKAEKEEILKN